MHTRLQQSSLWTWYGRKPSPQHEPPPLPCEEAWTGASWRKNDGWFVRLRPQMFSIGSDLVLGLSGAKSLDQRRCWLEAKSIMHLLTSVPGADRQPPCHIHTESSEPRQLSPSPSTPLGASHSTGLTPFAPADHLHWGAAHRKRLQNREPEEHSCPLPFLREVSSMVELYDHWEEGVGSRGALKDLAPRQYRVYRTRYHEIKNFVAYLEEQARGGEGGGDPREVAAKMQRELEQLRTVHGTGLGLPTFVRQVASAQVQRCKRRRPAAAQEDSASSWGA
mmetsp:Transcript_4035/g.9618  ORF Transcript_4035/g.9618 Transcript_4035/m.9618 type:complete len:278 (+) Transcript_4035:910-1743(+)